MILIIFILNQSNFYYFNEFLPIILEHSSLITKIFKSVIQYSSTKACTFYSPNTNNESLMHVCNFILYLIKDSLSENNLFRYCEPIYSECNIIFVYFHTFSNDTLLKFSSEKFKDNSSWTALILLFLCCSNFSSQTLDFGSLHLNDRIYDKNGIQNSLNDIILNNIFRTSVLRFLRREFIFFRLRCMR